MKSLRHQGQLFIMSTEQGQGSGDLLFFRGMKVRHATELFFISEVLLEVNREVREEG